MQVSSYLFDEDIRIRGFQKKCLHCAKLGNRCNGVVGDPKCEGIRTLMFYCKDSEPQEEINLNHKKLLVKIEKRLNFQAERHVRGGRNFRAR